MLNASERLRFHAPYMEWAKTRPAARFDLAGSNVLACSTDELPGAREAIDLTGRNEDGYQPLLEAIARQYGVRPAQVTTAQGTSGANFLIFAALLEPGDDVLIERPGYDPLLGAPRVPGANVRRFDRTFEDGWRVDPDRVARALTARTRLIVLTRPHNPTGALVDTAALEEIGRLAARRRARVLVDEVYLDASDASMAPAATMGPQFISTNSLTKSYGLAGLRSGWVLSSEDVAYRLRRARDVVDGTGSIVSERLSVLAFNQLETLLERSRTLLAVNGAVLRKFLNSRPELEWTDPAGGTVVFPRIQKVDDSYRFATRLLTERGTAIVPGRFFGAPAHFRIGFGGATEALQGGLAQISAALNAGEWT